MATIKDILGKVVKGEDLSDSEKTMIEKWEEPDVETIANARAANIRRDLEKKLQERDNLIAKKDEEIEGLKTGDLSELDKTKRELEKLTKASATLGDQLVQEKNKRVELERDHKIDSIVSQMRFIDGYNPEDARIILSHKLRDIDLEKDEDVKAKVTEFQTANKGVIVAAAGGGTGVRPTGGNVTTPGKYTREQIKNMTPAEFDKNASALWDAEKDGRIVT